ncbi:MAG: response regulator [Methylococcaceae bacterium]|nr:response regulator [Methylococcaceae bacterium]
MINPETHEKANILIVDDLIDNLKLLTDMLLENGYESRPVTNGKAAMVAICMMRPDLILLDIKMPEMDGFEVCKQLKADSKTKDIPVIFLSARCEGTDIIKGLELGAEDYITKPFNSAEVLARIKTHLHLYFSLQIIAKKNKQRNELIHILCHDLKNSVGATSTLIELLEIEKEADNIPEYHQLIKSATNNAIEIIDLVSETMCLEEGKYKVKLEKLDLKPLIKQAILIINNKFITKKIEPIINIADDITVQVEAVSFINSVVLNLLTNAVKFSYSGSKIIIEASIIDEKIKLTIQDFGTGMSAALCADIFAINKPTTRTGTMGETGTGFGMPLVKDFVESYNGTINIISTEKIDDNKPHGTTIIITLF